MTQHEFKDQEFGEVFICRENAGEMEAFLLRNKIPFKMEIGMSGKVNFVVRAGVDYRDAQLFALKKWGNCSDSTVVNQINILVLEKDFPEPEYAYEQYIQRRVDEELLSMYV